MVRNYQGKKSEIPPSVRGEISGFSVASRRRLKFVSSNAFPALISQFGMTYHKTTPSGHTAKTHLNAFLTLLRAKFPAVRYLWILEFQKRGTAHFHLFSTLEHSVELGKELGTIWNRIAEPSSKQHLQFHQHENNFIPWDMGSGSYLCKYLDKEAQKAVPVDFVGVGRFWGNSRGLVPEPSEIETSSLDAAFSYECIDRKTGEVKEFRATEFFIRQLCRHHEKSLGRSPWKSSARKRPTCYTLPNAAGVFTTLEKYISRQSRPVEDLPF
jgi:hypothetical protein